MVRHWFPTLGDPFRIPIATMMGYYHQIVKIENWKQGPSDSTTAHAQEMAEKMERRRLRRERLKQKR